MCLNFQPNPTLNTRFYFLLCHRRTFWIQANLVLWFLGGLKVHCLGRNYIMPHTYIHTYNILGILFVVFKYLTLLFNSFLN